MVDPSDPRLQQSKRGCILLGIPPIAVVLTILAYAWLVYTGLGGRPADGDVVEIALRGCPEARPVVEDRVARMGLPDPAFENVDGGFVVTARLPSDVDVARAIPETLAQPGRFQIRDAATGDPLADSTAVVDGTIRMDLLMRPMTLIRLNETATEQLAVRFRADRESQIALWLDGDEIGTWHAQKGMNGEIEVEPSAEDDKARLHLAARRGVVIGSGPLPCEVSVRSVTTVEVATPDRAAR